MAAALMLGIFFALLQVDLPLSLGPLTVYHTEIALLALALWALPRVKPGRWVLAFAPLGLWLLAHAFGPGSFGEGLKGALRAGQFALALALPALLIRDEKTFGVVLKGAFVAVSLSCLWGLMQSLSGPAGALNLGRESEAMYGFQAAAAGYGHHNQFAAMLVAAGCLAGAACLAGRARPWAAATLVLTVAALVATLSRGAWASAALALALFFFLLPLRLRLALAGGGLILVAGAYFGSEALRGRLLGMAGDGDRAAYLRAALPLFSGHSFWGWGSAALKAQVASLSASLPVSEGARRAFASHLHNSYLQNALEWGWPALVGWAIFLSLPLRAAWRGRRGPWGLGLLAAMAAFFLQASTDLLTLHARGMAVAFCWGLMLAGLSLDKGGMDRG